MNCINSQYWFVFDTSIGHFGVVWRDFVVCGMQLDEDGPEATARRIETRFPGARWKQPPGHITDIVFRVRQLFRGGKTDLSDIALDWNGLTAFRRQVYEYVRTIPPGEIRTYGSVAEAIGKPGASRAVGGALGHNRFPIVVPCHRVVASNGKLGGFTSRFGAELKRRMLVAEGAGGLVGAFSET